MLYIAHCSMESVQRDAVGKIGGQISFFNAVLDADSPDEAVAKLRRLITKLKKKGDYFGGTLQVFLESLMAVSEIPKDGFISYHVQGYPNDISTITEGPFGISHRQYVAYNFDYEKYGTGEDEEEHMEPFISFEKQWNEAD